MSLIPAAHLTHLTIRCGPLSEVRIAPPRGFILSYAASRPPAISVHAARYLSLLLTTRPRRWDCQANSRSNIFPVCHTRHGSVPPAAFFLRPPTACAPPLPQPGVHKLHGSPLVSRRAQQHLFPPSIKRGWPFPTTGATHSLCECDHPEQLVWQRCGIFVSRELGPQPVRTGPRVRRSKTNR